MSEPRVLVWLVLEQDGAVLLAMRKQDREPFGGNWTLPGDLMDESESASETIQRVARDELDVTAIDEEFIDTLFVADGEVEYAANVFQVNYGGRPRFRESGPYQMVRPFLTQGINEVESLMPAGLADLLKKTMGEA
jgi:hypothetical protein